MSIVLAFVLEMLIPLEILDTLEDCFSGSLCLHSLHFDIMNAWAGGGGGDGVCNWVQPEFIYGSCPALNNRAFHPSRVDGLVPDLCGNGKVLHRTTSARSQMFKLHPQYGERTVQTYSRDGLIYLYPHPLLIKQLS